MLTDSNGSGVRRYDYLPYGQELSAGAGGRTTAMLYLSAPDGVSPKFTGQDRDQETVSNDWFQVRYMDGAQGRFQSVDPGNAGANLGDPQTWNGYSYVGNNPLSATDPTGMFTCATCVAATTGNPVAIGIGAAIDVGTILVGLLGFGGGGPPPTIPPGLALPSSPAILNLTDNGNAGDPASPWQVGWEWLSGIGPRSHTFKDRDPFAETLRHHANIQKLIRGVCSGASALAGNFGYNLGGLQGCRSTSAIIQLLQPEVRRVIWQSHTSGLMPSITRPRQREY
jgi:RHS repeat-associated protein